MKPNNINEELFNTLIDIFAVHTVKEIEAENGALLKKALETADYGEAIENTLYKENYITLKSLRKSLDDILDDPGIHGLSQVKECLRLLKDVKEESPGREFEILSRLINKGVCTDRWDSSQREYYEKGLDMLEKWKDFFFSYTNRNLNETNNNFKHIIGDVFGTTDFEENREKVNCVARLIVHYLYLNNLSAFFDRDSMTCGDVLKENIDGYCKTAYAFVQLVEPVIFMDRGRQNWCMHEFSTFDDLNGNSGKNGNKRYYFIKTEEDVYPARLPAAYNKWKERIEERLHLKDLSALSIKQIRAGIKEIAKNIVETKNSILNNYFD